GGALPGDHHAGDEVIARRALLGQHGVAAVAVVADARRAQQHPGRIGHGRQRAGHQRGAGRPAPEDLPLAAGRPTLVADARAREVDDGVDPGQLVGVEVTGCRVPADLGGVVGRPPHQGSHGVPVGGEGPPDGGAEEPAGARDRYLHCTSFLSPMRFGTVRAAGGPARYATKGDVAVAALFKEFREFIARGNVVDLAVAVVIGAAFTAVVTAVVEGLITPLVGMIGGTDFRQMTFTVNDSTFSYGIVINAVIYFL